MQIDIGFGDVVVPGTTEINYPTLLAMPAPHLHGYPRESLIAEKFQAMVYLGATNSRMKDFYDVWLLARQFDFDGPTLVRAVKATFANRGTPIDPDPIALTSTFTTSDSAKRQWAAFLRKGHLTEAPKVFEEVGTFIASFLRPVALAARADDPFEVQWRAPGPWHSTRPR